VISAEVQHFRWDAVTFVAQHDHDPATRDRQVGEPDRPVGQLDAHDPATGGTLRSQPPQRIAGPVHTGRSPHRPQWRDDEVIPAGVRSATALTTDFGAGAHPHRAAHPRFAGGSRVKEFM
jgi:hypothetical protein